MACSRERRAVAPSLPLVVLHLPLHGGPNVVHEEPAPEMVGILELDLGSEKGIDGGFAYFHTRKV